MVTPVSLPAQQAYRPAQGNTPPHPETAFVFNFNSPAISHDEAAANAGDVFQKKNDSSDRLNPGINSPLSEYAPQTQFPATPVDAGAFGLQPDNQQSQAPGFNPDIQQQWLQQQPQQAQQQRPQAAQLTFGEAMPSTTPAFPAMPQIPAAKMPPSFPMPNPNLGSFGPYPQFPMMPKASPFAQPPAFPPQQAFPQQPMNFPAPPLTPPMPQNPIAQSSNSQNPMTVPPQTTAPEAPQQPPANPAPPASSSSLFPSAEVENYGAVPISDLNTMIAQPRNPDEKLAAINEIATRQQGDRQTYELLKQEISTPMQGIQPETANAIRQASLIAIGSLDGSPSNATLAATELYGMDRIDRILKDKNENPLIKASAVAALGYMNRPQDKTIQRLLKIAAKDTNPDVKNAVAQVQDGQMSAPAPNAPKSQ